MTPYDSAKMIIPNSLMPIIAGIFVWRLQGWVGAILAYIAVIGGIALLLSKAERNGWSLKRYLWMRFWLIGGGMTLISLGSLDFCDLRLGACSSPLF